MTSYNTDSKTPTATIQTMNSEKRFVVVGDELVAGAGDPRALGWQGRVISRTPFETDFVTFNLAAPGETTAALANRWWDEAERRFSPEADNRLIIGLGWADLLNDVSYHRARLNLVKIMDQASEKGIKTFVVGPPPMPQDHTQQIADYSRAYSEVVARRSAPYVDTFTPLVTHEQWVADFASREQRWPGQAGYGLMAWLVLHSGWFDWLGLPQPE